MERYVGQQLQVVITISSVPNRVYRTLVPVGTADIPAFLSGFTRVEYSSVVWKAANVWISI